MAGFTKTKDECTQLRIVYSIAVEVGPVNLGPTSLPGKLDP